MIRAHMATFPVRREIMMAVVERIAPQVDRMFICLNEYDEIPAELGQFGNVEAMIPDRDLKDLGKFAFEAGPDDIVFTVDDDILYPSDYVANTLALAERVGLTGNVVGYQGNAWVYKKRLSAYGWRNFLFFKPCPEIIGVTNLGTGTACMIGRHMPTIADLTGSEGFVDFRFSRLQIERGRSLWVLPRGDDYLERNLPEHLKGSSLFDTVARSGRLDVQQETWRLMEHVPRNSGMPFRG
ncbi:hypothetical protein [Paracoccus methylarcula]|uniref:Glycosyltransferase family 2 protein n=1 Tax=Paracoccus methylarcula TaxID=72022 RepID=A0A422QZW6_9RHOB|nr:hypothetical protein [Paracoccus methylarcula]RNF35514.1 hypothetical protein A7A09_003555 [Paracoccus methylarcula]